MNADQLLAHYEKIADTPEAIPRLRRFVLDLAVRGKLVPQDPNDEPASELVKRIAVGKVRLVEEGYIRNQEAHRLVDGEELDFQIPRGWQATRIGDLLTVIRGASPRPKGDPRYFSTTRTPYHWIKISDIRKYSKGRILLDTDEFLTKAGMEKSVLLPKGTLVVTNSATIGVPIFLGFEGGCIHDGYLAFPHFPKEELSHDYFFVLFQTLQTYASKVARGMAQQNLNTGLVRNFPLGLPPLAEQHRIVAKVDELMGLCDRLEAGRGAREAVRDRLAAASLARLNRPDPDEQTFRDHAGFALDNLTAITTRPDQIKQLRQTILNLAVRGKLVPQDPNDEPASELLKRIAEERAELVKKRQIRREKPLDPIDSSEPPFEVPGKWVWSRIGDAVLFTQYGTSQKSHPTDHGIPVLTMGNIQDGLVVWGNEKKIPESSGDLPALYLRKFDILYNRTNSAELVGKTGIYLGENDLRTFASYLIRIRMSQTSGCSRYLNMAMNAPEFRETQIVPLIKKQTGQANVNGTALKNMMIPLPPLAEQHRIVAKVDELMALCDRLEASLDASAATRRRLLDALLHSALSRGRVGERSLPTVSNGKMVGNLRSPTLLG